MERLKMLADIEAEIGLRKAEMAGPCDTAVQRLERASLEVMVLLLNNRRIRCLMNLVDEAQRSRDENLVSLAERKMQDMSADLDAWVIANSKYRLTVERINEVRAIMKGTGPQTADSDTGSAVQQQKDQAQYEPGLDPGKDHVGGLGHRKPQVPYTSVKEERDENKKDK